MNMLTPSPALLCKLGSIAVHADELTSDDGHQFDRVALQSLIADPEVREWIAAMGAAAMVPVKRKQDDAQKRNDDLWRLGRSVGK